MRELGRGSYGVVFLVRSILDGKFYVLKKMSFKVSKAKKQREALREAKLLRKLRHPHIIRYFHSFIESENLYMVMEYAEGGDMYNVR